METLKKSARFLNKIKREKNQEFNNKTCNNNISTDLQTKHSFIFKSC